MPSDNFFVFFVWFCFFAEASPSVQFAMASLGNVVMEKKKEFTKMCNNPEDVQSKPSVTVLCSTWTV